MISVMAYQTASLTRRIAAFVYDVFILVSFLFLATAVALLFIPSHDIAYVFMFRCYLFITLCLFHSFMCWRGQGQSLGMLAWRLRVISLEGQPETISFVRYCYRSFFTFLLCGLGFFAALFHPQKHCLHDTLSKTTVVKQ